MMALDYFQPQVACLCGCEIALALGHGLQRWFHPRVHRESGKLGRGTRHRGRQALIICCVRIAAIIFSVHRPIPTRTWQTTTTTLQALYRYVQDADLWTWALPDSKAFHAGLNASGMEYDARKNPGIWAALEGLDPETLKLQGSRELAVQQVSRDRVLRTAFPIALPGPLRGQRGLATLLEDDDALGARIRSTLGNDLASRAAELEGFAAVGVVAYREAGMPSDAVKLSFRSVGGLDVGAAAQAIGGGGHAAAAAGVVPVSVFEEMVQAAAADGK